MLLKRYIRVGRRNIDSFNRRGEGLKKIDFKNTYKNIDI